MLKHTMQFKNKKKEEELQQLEGKKTKISDCLKDYEKKIAEHDINDSLKNKDYIIYQILIPALKKEIEELENEIKKIKASLVADTRSDSKTVKTVAVNGNSLTSGTALSTGANGYQNNGAEIGIGLNQELEQRLRERRAKLEENNENTPTSPITSISNRSSSKQADLPKIVAIVPKTTVTQKSSEKEGNKPIISQQQLCEQIAKLKSRDKLQEINASQQEQELDSKLLADSQLDTTETESLYDEDVRLSTILEEDEDIVRRLSVLGQEQFLDLRKSIISIKSEFELDGLREFERLEAMIAQMEKEASDQVARLSVSQQFFKSGGDSQAKTHLNYTYGSVKPS